MPAKPKRAGPVPRTIPRAPTKTCDAGHRVAASWKLGDFCGHCYRAKHLADLAEAEQLARSDAGPAPAVLRMLVVSTGQVITYAIPKAAWTRSALARRRARR